VDATVATPPRWPTRAWSFRRECRHVTPHTEAFQAVVWHLLVSHPKLKAASTKWKACDDRACRSFPGSGRSGVSGSGSQRQAVSRAILAGTRHLAGVKEALQKAGAQKLIRIIVTNQPDVARGTLAREVVEAMHDRLRSELEIDDVLVCWHDDADGCACRKPKPGLLLEGAERHGVDMAKSFMVGTGGGTWRPARGPGVVLSGLTAATMNKARPQRRTPCHSLAEAVEWIGASAQR